MRINLGCGEFRAPTGWVNVDRGTDDQRSPDIVADLRKVLPDDMTGITRVYAGHVLEHLQPKDARRLLTRLHARMVHGGRIMVVGPDVERGRKWHANGRLTDDEFAALRQGASRWTGDAHLWDCTEAAVVDMLTEAGWRDVHAVPIEAVPAEWPVVSHIGWQCAVGAVA